MPGSNSIDRSSSAACSREGPGKPIGDPFNEGVCINECVGLCCVRRGASYCVCASPVFVPVFRSLDLDCCRRDERKSWVGRRWSRSPFTCVETHHKVPEERSIAKHCSATGACEAKGIRGVMGIEVGEGGKKGDLKRWTGRRTLLGEGGGGDLLLVRLC